MTNLSTAKNAEQTVILLEGVDVGQLTLTINNLKAVLQSSEIDFSGPTAKKYGVKVFRCKGYNEDIVTHEDVMVHQRCFTIRNLNTNQLQSLYGFMPSKSINLSILKG